MQEITTKMMNRVIIVEDESLAARRLIKMLEELRPEVQILATLTSVYEAEQYFLTHPTQADDLIFLDIQLSDGISLELFDKVHIHGKIIFVTAYDEYAIKAIKVNADDYLLKPIKIQELKDTLARLEIKSKSMANAELPPQQASTENRFLVKLGNSLKVIEMHSIAYFYSDAKLSCIVTWDGKRYPIDLSLDKVEESLLPKDFFRLNRKVLAHKNSMDTIVSLPKSRIKLTLLPALHMDLIVSTEKSASFKKWLAGKD